jgi:hypothetical protein
MISCIVSYTYMQCSLFFLPIHPNVDDMKHSSWGCQHESFCSLIWAGAKTINWPYPLGWFKKLLKVTKSYTLLLEHVYLFYMRWHDMKPSSWGCQRKSLCSLIWAGAKTITWKLDTSWGFTPAHQWGPLEQCLLTLAGALTPAPLGGALYLNSDLYLGSSNTVPRLHTLISVRLGIG